MHITNKHMLACVCAEKVYTDSVNAWMHDVKSTTPRQEYYQVTSNQQVQFISSVVIIFIL